MKLIAYFYICTKEENMEKTERIKKQNRDKIFKKIMAATLAFLMILSFGLTLISSLAAQ